MNIVCKINSFHEELFQLLFVFIKRQTESILTIGLAWMTWLAGTGWQAKQAKAEIYVSGLS